MADLSPEGILLRCGLEHALGAAAVALETHADEHHDIGIGVPDALAKAAILECLIRTGRPAEAEALRRVGI